MTLKHCILISGGSGLLAINWALRLRDNWEVHLLLNEREIELPSAQVHKVNLKSLKETTKMVKAINPHVLINTVGLTDVEKCENEPQLARLSNVTVAKNLAIAAKETECRFIHISTDQLYDGKKKFQNEEDSPHPLNHYGITKLQAELDVWRAYDKSLILRTNFFGWGPPYRRSFSDWIIDSLSDGKDIELYTNVFYTPIYIPVLIDAAHLLLGTNRRGLFNVVGRDRLSKYQFGMMLSKSFGFDDSLISGATLNSISKIVNRPLDMSLSSEKFNSCMSTQMPSIESMVEMLVTDAWIANEFRHLAQN